ncbi:MAG: hypothetical protein GY716_19035 [bacterium]|nr:hypothetical protein [bacterium]
MAPDDQDDGLPPDEGGHDEPIAQLRDLGVEPSAEFADRLRRRIQRRESSNHALWFSWHMPAAVALAFLDMVFALFGGGRDDGGGMK